jgi:hypothetical protein
LSSSTAAPTSASLRDGLRPLPTEPGRESGVAAIGMSYRAVRSPDQGQRSVCTNCIIVSSVGLAYPPGEWP